ncbi:inositol monophosphatase family protein [Nocardioides sp.]|uniref:inositol monophosphatase family protein n=1 Tax=Nocardioides sp. TaxID=35761 RepID=UPI002732E1A3|nr:inositol monophosphatase family protein [Nocardioides sp.]MDP3890413.1 inositol monophosphatase family protein [Nocardioides sp.]
MSTALQAVALTVAREAAALVRERRQSPVVVAATKSSDVDVVTEADRASEDLIRRRLTELRPGDAFLGEETGTGEGSTGVRWIVDPIDGTVNFLYGLPQYAVSIAAEVDGRTEAGVVINAATGVEYTAVRGQGATRDGAPIVVREPAPLAERLVLTGFWYDAELRAAQAAALVHLLPRVRDIRRMGSCALDLCHVAEGSADGYVEEGPQPWDHAAGLLIAEEAGARGELARGCGGGVAVVCAPHHGFEEFRAAVAQAGFLAASPT